MNKNNRVSKAIASLLNIPESQIEKIEEWDKIFRIKIKNQHYTFISKEKVYKKDQNIIFRKFLISKTENWNFSVLEFLSLKQLQSLCYLLGIPKSGTKAKLYERLDIAIKLRSTIKPFYEIAYNQQNENRDENYETIRLAALFFAGAYKTEELKEFSRMAKIWIAPCKFGNANGLINWLRQCLLTGQKNFNEAKNFNKKRQEENNSRES